MSSLANRKLLHEQFHILKCGHWCANNPDFKAIKVSIWSSSVLWTFRWYWLFEFTFGFKFTVANDTNALTGTSFHLWNSHGIRQMVNVDGSVAQEGGESLLQRRVQWCTLKLNSQHLEDRTRHNVSYTFVTVGW